MTLKREPWKKGVCVFAVGRKRGRLKMVYACMGKVVYIGKKGVCVFAVERKRGRLKIVNWKGSVYREEGCVVVVVVVVVVVGGGGGKR